MLRVKEKQEVAAYECRGHAGNVKVKHPEVEKWLGHTIPCIRDHLLRQERFQNSRQIFEFWTTGELTEDAGRCLSEAAEQTKKYQIRWLDGEAALEYVRSIKSSYLTNVLEEHYLNSPIAKAGPRRTRPASQTTVEDSVEPAPIPTRAALGPSPGECYDRRTLFR